MPWPEGRMNEWWSRVTALLFGHVSEPQHCIDSPRPPRTLKPLSAEAVKGRSGRRAGSGAECRFGNRVSYQAGVDEVTLSAIDAYVAGVNRDCSAAAFNAGHRPSSDTAWVESRLGKPPESHQRR